MCADTGVWSIHSVISSLLPAVSCHVMQLAHEGTASCERLFLVPSHLQTNCRSRREAGDAALVLDDPKLQIFARELRELAWAHHELGNDAQ